MLIAMKLKNKILSDPVNRWVFEHAKKDVFLVGGYVRDLIIKRKSTDRDFAVSGCIDNLSRGLARAFDGNVIHISRYNIRRVITHKKQFIDITPLGRNIESNLQKRDFTINAIAWSPESNFLDPLNGVSDIKCKLIKVTHKKSIKDDPLRSLRAFRIAAELDFNIHRDTLLQCQEYCKELSGVAEERKTTEIIKLLNNNNAARYLRLALKHKVLNKVIGLNQIITLKNIDNINALDEFMERVRLKHSSIYKALNLNRILHNEISQGMNRHSLIKMAILTYVDKSDEIHVIGLRLSNDIVKRLKLIHSALRIATGRLTQLKLYRIIKEAGICSEEVALIISMMKKDYSLKYVKKAQDLKKFIVSNKVNGYVIQREMKITSGDGVGHIKEEICRKWFLGELRTRQHILSFIRSNLT
jgi:tRNA nucleotidyltransferase/poly(A) polymerase